MERKTGLRVWILKKSIEDIIPIKIWLVISLALLRMTGKADRPG